ncbi:hydrogenase maturation protease [Lutibacter sp.]|uniref:hydrogenase maturation protease n=1 Tax=Lutibacter sp. TaxID=1925666 RepID=UPI0025B95FFD|nr:hydrogenase maturation protease [Lutibacter sp.]MCF6167124.1 hydrogenase maturation protease [Lutibacter sp.]
MNLITTKYHPDLRIFNTTSSLIYGIGNIGRQDDGLGWAFIDWLTKEKLFSKAETMKHYQLHLEDADLISHKKRVLFIDATKEPDVETFEFVKIDPKLDFTFTSHDISIASILATCKLCFDYIPEVYLLKIKGYEWELKEGLTDKAIENLNISKDIFKNIQKTI